MSDETAAEAEAAPGPARIAPLNLPVGSVRALMTLAVLGTVWALILRGQPVGEALRDTMLLVLGYYFGHRHAGAARPAADAYTTPAPREDNQKDPLYLPRGMIRLLVLVGFGAVAWKLHERGTLLTQTPPIMVLAGTFLIGAIFKGLLLGIGHLLTVGFQNGIGHAAAAGTLLVVFAYCAVEAFGLHALAPTWLTPSFLGVVGFYLGKR